MPPVPTFFASATRNSKPRAPSRNGRSRTEKKLRAEIDTLGEDRRKFNQALIDGAAKVKDIEKRLTANETRIKPLQDQERTSARLARRTPRRDRGSARGLAAHRPPAAAGRHGQPGRRAAIGAHRDPARRRAAGDARKSAHAVAADLSELVRIRTDIATEKTRLTADLATLGGRTPAHGHPDRGTKEEAGRNRKGARERTAECRRAVAPGGQPEGPDHPPGTGNLGRGQGRPQRRPAGRGTKARRTPGPRGLQGSRPAGTGRCICLAQGPSPIAGKWRENSRFRRRRRPRRHRKGHFGRQPGRARR